MSADILKEYLVSLGFQDNASAKMKNTYKKAERNAKNLAKTFTLASTVMLTGLTVVNKGIVNFTKKLIDTNTEVKQLAKETNKTETEAFKLKATLDAMGKSLEDIQVDERLTETFKRLQKDAENINPPDLSEGIKQVEAIQLEFTRLKQTGTYAAQWIGHYLFKYIQQPLEKTRGIFNGFNDSFINNIQSWAEKAAKFMSIFVRLGLTVIRAAIDIYKAFRKIFDMIPKELKIIGGILTALALFIRAGPIGQLITIITIALLLLEDFYTYISGGEALLGGVWQKLIDIYKQLEETGVFDKIQKSLETVARVLRSLYETTKKVIIKLNELGLLDKIIKGLVISFLGFKALSGVTGWLTVFADKLVKLKGTTTLMTTLFAKLKKSINIIAPLKKIGNALGGVPKFLKPILAIFKANPFMIWIVAIGALIGIFATLYKNSEGFRDFADKIKEKILNIAEKLKELIPAFLEMLPELLEVGIELLNALIEGLIQAIPALLKTITDLIKRFIKLITDNLPKIIQAGITILKALIKGLVTVLPLLITAVIDLIMSIITAIIDNLPDIIDAGIQILLALIEGIIIVLPMLIEAAISLLLAIIDAIIENIDIIIEGGIKIIIALVSGIIKALPKLVAAIPKIINAVMDGLGKLRTMVLDLGKNLIEKLWEGISSMGNWISDKVGGFVKGLFSKEKIEADISTSETATDKTPGHADGGIFDKAHIAHVSEDNKPEAIIPLTKPDRAREVLQGAMSYLGMNSSEDLTSKLSSFTGFAEKASSMLSSLNTGLNQTPVQHLNNSNSVSNNNYDMQSHFTIYDSSGNPQTTATAVDRTIQLRYRNLRGVLN